jgi:hypothetical protein
MVVSCVASDYLLNRSWCSYRSGKTSGGFSLDVQAADFSNDARDDTATKSRHHSAGWVNLLVRNHQRALSAEVSFTIRTDRGSRE